MSMADIKPTYEKGYYKGSPYIKCLKCNRWSYNRNDYDTLYCAYCKSFHASTTNPDIKENINPDPTPQIFNPISNNGSNITSTSKNENTIYCDKCMEQLHPISEGSLLYRCNNGHSIYIQKLEPLTVEEPKISKVKKRRSIELKCKKCGKVAEVVKESKVFGKIFREYTCGHSEFLPLLSHPSDRDEKWNKFFEFQHNGIQFIEDSNYKALLGDEMGLGKTVQALGAYRYNYTELAPCLIVCEASKVYDWKQEFIDWVGDKYNEIVDEPIIHPSGQYGLCPGFRNHIISMSLLNKPKILKSINEYGFKLAIVDESHSFKNEDADRTYALQQICKTIPHQIFLSGTPVMNKVEEFFTTLNILRPSHFPSKAGLIAKCDRSDSGRILGLNSYYRDRFFKMTSEYILRRTKKQVGIQLPKLSIHKLPVNINTDKNFVNAYNNELDNLEKILDNMKSGGGCTEILGIFAKLRHITGLAKVRPALEYVREFLDSTDQENKIAIGVHHKLVMDFLAKGLAEYRPICISDEDGWIKANRIEQFKHINNRVAILSILGAGQGLNIQFCKNALQCEREWNPSKENQFHGRFHRIVKNEDGSIKTEFQDDDAVIIDIMNAKGSIDDYFDATVALKQEIVDTTVDADMSVNLEFMLELARKIVSARLQLNKDV